MKRNVARTPRAASTPRVPPFPQTPKSAAAWLKAHGVPLSEVARAHQISRHVLSDLLRGQLRGNRGQAHLGAIVLGIKAAPVDEGASA